MTSCYKKDGMFAARQIMDELVLVPIRHNVGDLQYFYTLNGVASRIWQLLDDSMTVEKIVLALIQEYEVEAAQVEPDVLEFLAQMKDIGAVVEGDEREVA